MNSKQGHGDHPDHPPIENGYTGLDKDRRVPRYPEPKLSPSQVGGLGHVHGMHCDGRADCDVQQAYYKRHNPDAIPAHQRRFVPHEHTTAGLAAHQLSHLDTLFQDLTENISGKLAVKLVQAYREVCGLYTKRCNEVVALESQLREIEERAKPRHAEITT